MIKKIEITLSPYTDAAFYSTPKLSCNVICLIICIHLIIPSLSLSLNLPLSLKPGLKCWRAFNLLTVTPFGAPSRRLTNWRNKTTQGNGDLNTAWWGKSHRSKSCWLKHQYTIKLMCMTWYSNSVHSNTDKLTLQHSSHMTFCCL